MAGRQRAVRVFVDDAVQGGFPPVCASTGQPSDGWTTLHASVGGSGASGAAWLLLLLGPPGWGIFLVLCVFGSPAERLSVELPWTEAVHLEVEALRRRRAAAWWVAGAGVAGALVAVVLPVGQASMAAQVVAVAAATTAVVALGAALVANREIGRRTPTVELDASRRWVTLGNVDPAFVRVVAADQAERIVPR